MAYRSYPLFKARDFFIDQRTEIQVVSSGSIAARGRYTAALDTPTSSHWRDSGISSSASTHLNRTEPLTSAPTHGFKAEASLELRVQLPVASRRQVWFFVLLENSRTKGMMPTIESGTGNRGRVKAHSAERKEALLRRMMPPENKLVSQLARETGIS